MSQLTFNTSNNFMEKRGSFSGASALTKSAAWAWLERRSNPASRPTTEFDVSRSRFHAKPSRHKAEAVRKIEEKSNSTRKIDTCPTKSIRCEGYYSLLDRYEIERISRQLDYYIESSCASRGGNHGGRRAEAVAETKSKHRREKKVVKGLWLGSHAPLACGSSRGVVVDRASIEYSRQRRSLEKRRAAAVEVVGCRPRQGIRG